MWRFRFDSVVCCVRFSHDGKFLATGCNRTVQIYDTRTGQKTCVLMDDSVSRQGTLFNVLLGATSDSRII
jgi:general transcriptional corepressor TUP1